MKLRVWSCAALAFCVLTAGAAAGRAQSKGVRSVEFQDAEQSSGWDDGVDLASYQTAVSASVGPGPRGGGYIGGIPSIMDRPIQVVAGAQYIYARANFSQALAYVEQDLVNGGETWVNYDFNYNSSYGFYGGIYMCDCGGSLIFNFNRFTSDASFAAANVPAQTTPTQTAIFGPFEIDGNITGFADVDLKSYDLSFAKTIPLGGPLCGCCDDCCEDSCCDDACCGGGGGCCQGGGCGCPAWDITWSGGIRFADVNWGRGATATTFGTAPVFIDSYTTRMDFEGFGGRVGLAGRRYLGKRGLFSLYAKGDWSLLSGEINLETLVTNQAGTAFHRTSGDIIVPVTEIELGGTVHLGCHANITAGYFWSAWHDLGMREEYAWGNFQMSHYDDANILGFDGLFVRGEVLF
ncbi:MAG: hypothetical protein KF688_02380 [Pirellulales bacterium]|nr:hypothetical protein [Pirellulales bacterium]